MTKTKFTRRVALLVAATIAAAGITVATVGPAVAASVFPTMNDQGGIYWRSAPN